MEQCDEIISEVVFYYVASDFSYKELCIIISTIRSIVSSLGASSKSK
jgi:hypothetical protein